MRVKDICMSCMQEKGNVKICPHCGWNENTPAVSPLHLPPGTILLDRYIIGRALGQGTCGITYRGYDILRNEILAIKEYFPAGLASRVPGTSEITPHEQPEARQAFREGFRRFIEEGEALKDFSNESGMVPVRACMEANETAYLIMTYIKGKTLQEYLADPPQLMSFNDAIKMIVPVLGALSRLHRAGLLHRDVSPENIMITEDSKPWLLDFGSVRLAVAEKCHNQGTVLKNGFAPCEQHYSLAAQGSWTDVYGAAATIYFAITGQPPPESLARVHKDNLMAPSRLGIDIPEYAEEALLKALAVRANERYHRISEFANDLRRPRQDESSSLSLTDEPSPDETASPDESANPGGSAVPNESAGPDSASPLTPGNAVSPCAAASAAGSSEKGAADAVLQPPADDSAAETAAPAARQGAVAPSDMKSQSLDWLLNKRTLVIFLVLMLLGLIIGLLSSVFKFYIMPEADSAEGDSAPSRIWEDRWMEEC